MINSIKGKKDKIILFSINNYFKDIINDLTGSKVDFQNLSFICFVYGHQFKSFKKLYSSIKIKYILDNKKCISLEKESKTYLMKGQLLR